MFRDTQLVALLAVGECIRLTASLPLGYQEGSAAGGLGSVKPGSVGGVGGRWLKARKISAVNSEMRRDAHVEL